MDLRITPLSSLSTSVINSANNTSAKTNQTSSNTRFNINNNLNQQSQTLALAPPKKELITDRALIISKGGITKPTISISTLPNGIQPSTFVDKKGVLLYQQIERNKLFSNDSELINRFNIKV